MFKKTENFSKILVQHLFVVNLIKFIDCLVRIKIGCDCMLLDTFAGFIHDTFCLFGGIKKNNF